MAAQTIRAHHLSQGNPAQLRTAGHDLPFYDGAPARISADGWAAILVACGLAFVQLSWVPLPVDDTVARLFKATMFAVLPLLGLAWAAPRGWTALLRRISGRDIGAMLGFAALNLAVILPIALWIGPLIGAHPHPAVDALADMSTVPRMGFLVATIPQAIGEELLTILPMLALMAYVTHRGWSRGAALATAWAATAVMFALVHLPAYDWNVLQCLMLIGVSRLLLTLAYVATRNLAVSTGAHLVSDWAMLSAPLLIGAAGLA